jgi:hypothetical protein
MGNNRARGIVAIMIVISVIVLIFRFSLEYILNFNIKQQEQNALDTLKLVSTAVENYAKDHQGVFPSSLSELVKTDPPYIEKGYYRRINIDNRLFTFTKGYNYDYVGLEQKGYKCLATPVFCGLTGRNVITVSTGQVISQEECSKKE